MSAFPGYAVVDGFIDADRADQILRSIQAYAGLNAPPLVERGSGRRPLHYSVIDGLAIRDHLPQLEALSREVNGLVNELMGAPVAPIRLVIFSRLPCVSSNSNATESISSAAESPTCSSRSRAKRDSSWIGSSVASSGKSRPNDG